MSDTCGRATQSHVNDIIAVLASFQHEKVVYVRLEGRTIILWSNEHTVHDMPSSLTRNIETASFSPNRNLVLYRCTRRIRPVTTEAPNTP